MSVSTLTKSPMVKFLESYRRCAEHIVSSGKITPRFANEMYVSLMQEKELLSDLSPLIMEKDDGVTDCYDGIHFFFDDAEYQDYIEVEHGEFYDDIQNDIIANYDGFTIHKIAKHQGEDDYLNYEFPCGEDRWHVGIVFRIKSIA